MKEVESILFYLHCFCFAWVFDVCVGGGLVFLIDVTCFFLFDLSPVLILLEYFFLCYEFVSRNVQCFLRCGLLNL